MNLKSIQTGNILFLTENLIHTAGEFAKGFIARPGIITRKIMDHNRDASLAYHPSKIYSSPHLNIDNKLGVAAHDTLAIGGASYGIGKLTANPTQPIMYVDKDTNTEFNPTHHDIQSSLLGASAMGLGAFGLYKHLKNKRNDN